MTGPAGSGKTMLAIAVAKQLADGGTPNASHVLQHADSATYLARVDVGCGRGLDVAHFHGLCVGMAKEAGLDAARR